MSAEFNWWLLIVGLVAGGVLTWLVMADSNRRDAEVSEEELAAEAGWIARSLDDPLLDADATERVLRAHRRYLGFPPPDVLVDPEDLTGPEPPDLLVDQEGLAGPETQHAATASPDPVQPA